MFTMTNKFIQNLVKSLGIQGHLLLLEITKQWWGWVFDVHGAQDLISPPLKLWTLWWWHEVRKGEKGKIMLSFSWFLFWHTPKEWARKIVEINRLLRVQFTFWKGKCQPKYIYPCCEKLWGSKKLNQHFFTTPCLMVKAIANHKLWPIEKTIMKGTLQITSMLGVISSWTLIPTKPRWNTWFGSSNQEQSGQTLSPSIVTMQGSFNLHMWHLKSNFNFNIGTMFATCKTPLCPNIV